MFGKPRGSVELYELLAIKYIRLSLYRSTPYTVTPTPTHPPQHLPNLYPAHVEMYLILCGVPFLVLNSCNHFNGKKPFARTYGAGGGGGGATYQERDVATFPLYLRRYTHLTNLLRLGKVNIQLVGWQVI